ncbi:MAG: hypothetical protein ACOYI4_03135 [Christensenellales bacterium]|jgi:hypothetical protein
MVYYIGWRAMRGNAGQREETIAADVGCPVGRLYFVAAQIQGV